MGIPKGRVRTEKVSDVPKEVADLAEDIVEMLSKRPSPPSIPVGSGWSDAGPGALPDDVEEWGSKEFVRWFAKQCHARTDVSFSPLFARDCPLVKKLMTDLKRVGREKKSDLRDFLDWTFDNSGRILRERGGFTLNSIRYFMNDFLQISVFVQHEGDERPRRDLLSEMDAERHSGLAQMLHRYGVPLVASYAMFRYDDKANIEAIERNIDRHLREATDPEFVRVIAKRSHDGSPYPSDFSLLDWRGRFSEVWDRANCRSQTWWREEDNVGRPLIEYEDIIENEN